MIDWSGEVLGRLIQVLLQISHLLIGLCCSRHPTDDGCHQLKRVILRRLGATSKKMLVSMTSITLQPELLEHDK